MTKDDTELFLKDLCARLPYGVKGRYNNMVMSLRMIDPFDNYRPLYCANNSGSEYADVDEFKPYLFPMSSMTEEQKKEYDSIIYHDVELHCERYYNVIDVDCYEELHDFFHKNHLDYRGLIEKGLAIDATGLNIY